MRATAATADDSGDSGDSGDASGDSAGPRKSIWATSTAAIRATTRPRRRSRPGWAREAQKRGLPAELPVMAGLVESGLRNLNYGDADSVGFFQMRVGIWDQGDYAGYPDKPELQLKWFLDQARRPSSSSGSRSGEPVDDPEQLRRVGRRRRAPGASSTAAATSCASRRRAACSTGRAGQPRRRRRRRRRRSDAAWPAAAARRGPAALAAVAEAKKYLGTPYQWGGSTPQTGFDCSGLVQWAYAKAGIQIPRTSRAADPRLERHPVDRRHLIPGDLVFFRDSGGDVHHVGISLGGDKFIHAPHTGDVVKIASLDEPYYARAVRRRPPVRHGRANKAQWVAETAGAGQGSAPVIDPDAVKEAEAALARDAAEVQRPGSLLSRRSRCRSSHKEDLGYPRLSRRSGRPTSSRRRHCLPLESLVAARSLLQASLSGGRPPEVPFRRRRRACSRPRRRRRARR